MSKLLNLSITVMLTITNLGFFLLTSIAIADHLAPEVKTQLNQQSDLFDQSISDLPALKQQLMQSQQDNINSMGDGSQLPPALNVLTNKEELESKRSKLQAISEHDLEVRGREELIKQNMMSLHPDYSLPGNSRYLKDAESLAGAQDSLLSNLLGKLKDLGVDCKTVKGDQRHEPEYYVQISQQQVKDTVYNQVFCEELMNKYNCKESLFLRCSQRVMQWNPWQNRTITIPYNKIPQHWWNIGSYTDSTYHGRNGYGFSGSSYTVNPACHQEITMYIASAIGVKVEQVHVSNQNIVLIPHEGLSTNVDFGSCPNFMGMYLVWEVGARVTFHYLYRDGYEICQQWQEEWIEQCTLEQ